MNVIYYARPNGEPKEIDVLFIRDRDANWFEEHNVIVSMEQDPIKADNYILYAKWGREDDQEVIELSMGRDCYDSMTALRKSTEQAIKMYGHTMNTIR